MAVKESYQASDIEVLSGLEPVRKRPGMFTDTSNPNHLLAEVVDNSVDEALAGHARRLEVLLEEDGTAIVTDDGRGMPIDLHPEHGVPGVELILTRLHAGGKFSGKAYRFAGGLHGVGVSVVNALSSELEVRIRRAGGEYRMAFAHGEPVSALSRVRGVRRESTGTTVRFKPAPQYFDTPRFSLPALLRLLRAKAVLCPGLEVVLREAGRDEPHRWYYETGLEDYLRESMQGTELLPANPFQGSLEGEREAVSWAVHWLPGGGETLTESYVNLVPTPQGGTHVNGLRLGLSTALREFCEARSLLPRRMRLVPEDIWRSCAYLLSVKLISPMFTGQTKQRLVSRECCAFVSGAVRDAFSHWLHGHVEMGERIVAIAIANARIRISEEQRMEGSRKVSTSLLPSKLFDCAVRDAHRSELFLVEGKSAGGSACHARDRYFQAVLPLRGKILNTWEVDAVALKKCKEVHDISLAIGVRPGCESLEDLRYGKICILADADSDGAHIAALLCGLFLRHFRSLVLGGHVYVAMPPLYRIDIGKQVSYALDEERRMGCWSASAPNACVAASISSVSRDWAK